MTGADPVIPPLSGPNVDKSDLATPGGPLENYIWRPDALQVTMGPGGRTDILQKTDAGIPPSQQGVGGTLGKHLVLTNEPTLDEPAFPGLSNWSLQLGASFVHIFVGIPFMAEGEPGADIALREELQFVAAGTEEEVPVGGAGYVGVSEPEDGGGPPLPPDTAFNEWVNNFWAGVPTDPAILPPEVGIFIDQMQSDRPEDIYEALFEMADLDSMNLTPAQKTAIIKQLKQLANVIANANAAGGSVVLNLTIPELVTAFLIGGLDYPDDPSISDADKELFTQVLLNVGKGLGAINFESLVGMQAPSQEYQDLTSGDIVRLSTLLSSLIGTTTLPEGLSQEEFNILIKELARELAALSPEELSELLSADPATVSQLLSKILNSLAAEGKISPATAELFSTELLPVLSGQIAQISEMKLRQDVRSGDFETTFNALDILTGASSDPNLTPTEKQLVIDYLKALTIALCFMAQIRCLISQLENQFSQELAAAKMSTLADQVSKALELFQTKVNELELSTIKQLKAIRLQKIMKFLMPIVAIAIALLSVIAIIFAISSVVTGPGGVSAAIATTAAIAKLVALVVAAAVTTVVLVVTVADAACQWSKSKGLFEMLGNLMGVEDPAAIAAIGMAFEIVTMIIVAACTLGAAGIAMGAAKATEAGVKAAIKTGMKIIKDIIKGIVKSLTEAAKKGVRAFLHTLRMTLMGSAHAATLTTVFLGTIISGVTPIAIKGLTELLKLMGADDQAAAIAAVIIIIMITLASMVLMYTGISGLVSGVKKAAGAVRGAAESVQSSIDSMKNSLYRLVNRLQTLLKTGLTSPKASIDTLLKQLVELLLAFAKRVGKNLAQTLKNISPRPAAGFGKMPDVFKDLDPKFIFNRLLVALKDAFSDGKAVTQNIIRFLTLLTDCLRIASLAIQAKASRIQAEHQEELAEIKEDIAALEAMLVFLTQLQGIDQTQTIDNIMECSKEASDNWLKLIQMVGSFVDSASQNLSSLTSTGAA